MSQHLFYIFNQERLLIKQTDNSYTIYSGDECPDFVQCTSLHLFAEHEDTQCYVGTTTDEGLPEGYQWIGLRESYHLLPGHLYQEAGKAAEIRYFDTHHRYCGLCGGAMVWNTPISKRCTGCNDEIWPQLNTAIIVLVRRGEEALRTSDATTTDWWPDLWRRASRSRNVYDARYARRRGSKSPTYVTLPVSHGPTPWD